jgi:hypothetical protein
MYGERRSRSASRTGSGRAQLADGVVEIDGVPQRDRVQDEAERAELVFHPVAVAVAELPFAVMERGPAEVVAAFLGVADRLLVILGYFLRKTPRGVRGSSVRGDSQNYPQMGVFL